MRKFILIFLLALVSLDAMAEWVGGWKILGNPGTEMSLYVNSSTLERDGNKYRLGLCVSGKTTGSKSGAVPNA